MVRDASTPRDVRLAYVATIRDLERTGCSAASYRLSGSGEWPRHCVKTLPRNWKLILDFPADDEVRLLVLEPHDNRNDPYLTLANILGVDREPGMDHDKPDCCEVAGPGSDSGTSREYVRANVTPVGRLAPLPDDGRRQLIPERPCEFDELDAAIAGVQMVAGNPETWVPLLGASCADGRLLDGTVPKADIENDRLDVCVRPHTLMYVRLHVVVEVVIAGWPGSTWRRGSAVVNVCRAVPSVDLHR